MRTALQAFENQWVFVTGKIFITGQHRSVLKHINVLNFFCDRFGIIMVPIPDNFYSMGYEDHILLDNSSIPEDIHNTQYVKIIGKIGKYQRKSGSEDYCFEKITHIIPVDEAEYFYSDAANVYCQKKCPRWDDCSQATAAANFFKATYYKKSEPWLNDGISYIPMYNSPVCNLDYMKIVERAVSIEFSVYANIAISRIENIYQDKCKESFEEAERMSLIEVFKKFYMKKNTAQKISDYQEQHENIVINEEIIDDFIFRCKQQINSCLEKPI